MIEGNLIIFIMVGVCIGYIIGRYNTIRLITKNDTDDMPIKFRDKYYFIVLDKVFYRLKNKK